MFAERKGKRISHIVHVPVAICRWQCLQRLNVRHVALSSVRQRLRDNICETVIGSGSSAGIWIPHFGKQLRKINIYSSCYDNKKFGELFFFIYF